MFTNALAIVASLLLFVAPLNAASVVACETVNGNTLTVQVSLDLDEGEEAIGYQAIFEHSGLRLNSADFGSDFPWTFSLFRSPTVSGAGAGIDLLNGAPVTEDCELVTLHFTITNPNWSIEYGEVCGPTECSETAVIDYEGDLFAELLWCE
jgi:hypothetical protein